MSDWFRDAFLYHLYPLGALGAPARNDFASAPVSRLNGLQAWIESAADLGANALYLGPVFESSAHGYDTADYFHVDRRLGQDSDLSDCSQALHRRGMRLLLDGVFHHVGRDFWAFRDVLAAPDSSPFRSWFHLDPAKRSPYGDPFGYQGWHGNYDLVKLNTQNPELKNHLFDAVRSWQKNFAIDGLRLDAADVLDIEFQRELAGVCRALDPDFALLGEVIHGDYRRWIDQGKLDSVTNYEVYKGLYSSHNDRNYFEIAHSLARQFGPSGRYVGLPLCSFVDNHDVDRIASRLRDPAELYPLHILLFTIPGVPAIYYGSEWGIAGRKGPGDEPLRPALTPDAAASGGGHADLRKTIVELARIRRELPALRRGAYSDLAIASRQFAFQRSTSEQKVVVAVNAAEEPVDLVLQLPGVDGGRLHDVLDGERSFAIQGGQTVLPLAPRWGRVLRWSAS